MWRPEEQRAMSEGLDLALMSDASVSSASTGRESAGSVGSLVPGGGAWPMVWMQCRSHVFLLGRGVSPQTRKGPSQTRREEWSQCSKAGG